MSILKVVMLEKIFHIQHKHLILPYLSNYNDAPTGVRSLFLLGKYIIFAEFLETNIGIKLDIYDVNANNFVHSLELYTYIDLQKSTMTKALVNSCIYTM